MRRRHGANSRRAPSAAAVLVAGWLAACNCERTPLGQTHPPGWKRVYPSFAAQVHDLLRDPSDPRVIYADPRVIYAACDRQTSGQTTSTGGVLRSTDGGQSWDEANQGIPPHADVLALAAAPRGFAGEDRGLLLAGTRRAGIYASSDRGDSWRQLGTGDGAPEWERLTIQTLVSLPGDPPTVAAGTRAQGVLVSEDGGVSWQTHNEGLLSPNVQALTLTSDGVLLAGTWSGGLYESRMQEHEWTPLATKLEPAGSSAVAQDANATPLDTTLERSSISAVAQDVNGTLWVGLQNAGLVARLAGADAFEPQGSETLEGVGILTIVPAGDRVVAGTSGHGVAIGHYSGEFVMVAEDLGNPTVTAVLLDPDKPGELLVGTWEGLYRSMPSASRFELVILAAGLLVLALTGLLAMAFLRSTSVQAALAVYQLSRIEPLELPVHLNRTMARLALGSNNGQVVLARLARWLARAGDETHSGLAEVLRATVPLMGLIGRARGKSDAAVQRRIADALDLRIAALDKLSEGASANGEEITDLRTVSRIMASQDRLFASLLRAESPGHLAALDQEIQETEELAQRFPTAPFFNRHFLEDLCGIVEGLAPLNRLPSAEDRAPFLGRSLTRTLEAQEHLVTVSTVQPSFVLVVGSLALESVRQILATALRDLSQRAELVLELRSKVVTARREAVVVLEIRNAGQGHAQNIEVILHANDQYFRSLQSRQSVRGLLRQQSAQLEFLIEPRLSDRVRLTCTLTYDDLERRDRRLEFADMVEFRQVESRSFLPLHPNPYVVGRPLAFSDVFIGRGETFHRIASSLAGAHQDNVIILVGQRRMGKTSILRRLPAHLADTYLPVLIDLQGFLGTGETAFFHEIAAALHDELEEAGIHLDGPTMADFEVDPGTVFRRRYLRGVRRALGERKLLILFDEFEVIEERIREGELKPRILPYLRSLMQHETSVSFLFAGTHRLDQLTGDYWSVLFNLAVYLQVGHLSEDDVTQLFTRPVAGCFEIDPLALAKVYLFTGGHPHFSQLLARELVDFRNRRRLTYVTVQDVNIVAGIVADKGQLHIAYLWNEATRDERLLLLTLERLLQREGTATVAAAHRYLSEHRVETEDLPAAAHALKRREILNDQGGTLTFRMGLLRLWMERHHDFESFLLSEGRDTHPGGLER